MFDRAKEQAASLAEKGSGYARVAGEKAQNFHAYASAQAKEQSSALAEAGYGLKESAGQIYDAKKKEGMHQLFDMAAGPQKKVLFALREVVKDGAVADPYMGEWIKSRIKDTVDLFWVDLENYLDMARDDLRDQKTGKMTAQMERLDGAGADEKMMPCGLFWWRSKVLYSWWPFDISVFGQVRDPLFWILTVLSCVTIFGIRIITGSVILLFILLGRPADEYQITQFILTFKGLQFISSGVALGITAAVKYYICVHPDGTHTCNTDGPGATQGFSQGMVDWLGSSILVWVAFAFLPCSDRTAGLREIGTEDAEALAKQDEDAASSKGCCGQMKYDKSRGGRLRGLMTYDLVCFLLSLVFLLLLMYRDAVRTGKADRFHSGKILTEMNAEAESPEGHIALFWARMIYSFMALPFTFFKIPGIFDILTHTVPTGYNRHGKCVPYLLKQERA
jgi:hypothetical protein